MPLHHLALRCADPEALAGFYRDLFELPLARVTESGSRWLDLGDGSVLMLERREATEPAVPQGSMEFFALATDEPGLARFEARCAALGVTVEHRTRFTRYARDPEGRRVGVSCYPLDAKG